MKKKSRISNVCESIVMKVKLFIIYYGERRKIKNYADFNGKIIHDLEEEESRITNHWNWLILIIKLSMSLTKIYNFHVFVSSFSSGQSTQMTKQRLVSSKFEEDWLAPVARAVTCHTFERWKMRPLFVSLVDLFQNRKKKEEKEKRLTFGRHVLRTFVSASRLFSPPSPYTKPFLHPILLYHFKTYLSSFK